MAVDSGAIRMSFVIGSFPPTSARRATPTLVSAVRVLRYPATGISGLRVSLVGEALGLPVGSPLAPDGAAEVPHAAASRSASASVKRLRRRGKGA
jgi:hypothetical protein